MSDQNEIAPTPPSEIQLLKARATMMGIVFSNNIGVESLKAKIAEKSGQVVEQEDDQQEQVDTDESDAQYAIDAQDEPIEKPSTVDNVAEPESKVMSSDPIPPVIPDPPVPAAMVDPSLVHRDPPMQAPVESTRRLTKAEENMRVRKELRDEQMRLIRLRITNMDPKKSDLQGEIFTVANEYLGTVRKFIPYGEVTDEGYHVPYWIYQQMLERKFQMIRTVKDKRTGALRPESRWMNEFALEILPQLTREELDRLAVAQMAAGSMDEYV